MALSKSSSRTLPKFTTTCTPRIHLHPTQRRCFSVPRTSTNPYALKRQAYFFRSIAIVSVTGSFAYLYTLYTTERLIRPAHAEAPNSSSSSSSSSSSPDTRAKSSSSISSLGSLLSTVRSSKEEKEAQAYRDAKPEQAEITFEPTRKPTQGSSKDSARDQISSQHLQVKKSWENPGVWCWGANDGKVAAPDGKENLVKNPKWMSSFDGVLLRDLKLTREFGAAITEEGDLLQWGAAYSKGEGEAPIEGPARKIDKNVVFSNPTPTLTGKDLTHLAISRDRILALSSSGTVYSLSVSREEQANGPKPLEYSWYLPFYPSRSPISYRTITPSDLGWSERVTSITSGLDHALLLTSSGRVFSAASASSVFPSRGQLGVPGLTWFTRPEKKPFDTPHEVQGLHGFKVTQVAAGDYHSVALDVKGRAFAWGDNQRGQLGTGDTSKETTFYDAPAVVPVTKLYAGTTLRPRVRSVHAGGNTSFFAVDAERVASPQDNPDDATGTTVAHAFRGLGRITSDVWSCGHGIWGQLGNGRWTHVAPTPVKIAPLSGLFEYDEHTHRAVPIRLRSLSVGASHVAAVLDNVTYLAASEKTSEHDTNWGADVLFFGNNEFYQLGTGKRNNVVVPTYIQPLDRRAEVSEGNRAKGEEHRLHVTPRSRVNVGGRSVWMEQRVEAGRGVTAVYSGV